MRVLTLSSYSMRLASFGAIFFGGVAYRALIKKQYLRSLPMKLTGIVKFWNGLTYGFIKPNDASGHVYFDAYAVPTGSSSARMTLSTTNWAKVAKAVHAPLGWSWPMDRLWALRGDLLTKAAILAVVAIMLWFMP
jgi:hypothetical protein